MLQMESTGVAGAIQCTYAFIKSLPDKASWNYLTRGNVDVKGKGGGSLHRRVCEHVRAESA
jgi:hypothetical protein